MSINSHVIAPGVEPRIWKDWQPLVPVIEQWCGSECKALLDQLSVSLAVAGKTLETSFLMIME